MKRYKKVYVEITNICNLRCNFCPDTKRPARVMDIAAFEHIANQIKPVTDHIYLHLMGEPLLNPHLDSFLEICSQNGLSVNITTNGTLLNKVKDILLNAPALRKVSVSLHSFEANEGTTELGKYLRDTLDFVKEASSKGIICELRLWNKDSEGIKASNDRNSDIIGMIEMGLGLDYSLQTAIEHNHNLKLKDRIFVHVSEKFEWPDIERDKIHDQAFCYGLRDHFGILADGTVVPCCLDNEGNIALGNMFEQPLTDILSSDRARKIYDGFSKRNTVEELCKKCGYSKRH